MFLVQESGKAAPTLKPVIAKKTTTTATMTTTAATAATKTTTAAKDNLLVTTDGYNCNLNFLHLLPNIAYYLTWPETLEHLELFKHGVLASLWWFVISIGYLPNVAI